MPEHPLTRPDPARGVFETLLVHEGDPVAAETHFERLTASLDALYSLSLPPEAPGMVRREAAAIGLGRLRLTAVPEGGGLRLEVAAEEVDPAIVFPSRGVRLRRHSIPGGLGPHKLVDRSAIDAAMQGPGPLVVDRGEALEAGWANLFAVRDEALWTPPLDGRLLPGTTRAALLRVASEVGVEVVEGPLDGRDIEAADEVFLSGSVRGVEAALELDGVPLAACGPLSRRLAAGLRRRWRLPERPAVAPLPAGAPRPDRSAR
jgi:para-aminobenzoate synthetase/4-amino-4-deoxychorismate lyase